MKKIVDLRSDAVTLPTDEMQEAMKKAKVGDDEFGEDPTVNYLEQISAELTGKKAGLFVPSSTMANLIAILVYIHRDDGIIVGSKAHIYDHEYPGIIKIAGIQYHPIKERKIGFRAKDLVQEIEQNKCLSSSRVSLVAIENTHNRTGGTVMTSQKTSSIVKIGKKYGIPVYLDGARIFNAAVALGVEIKELTKDVDSLSFCLSKALAAPVGSVLVGPTKFIKEARRVRWMLGGAMKQSGVLAAAGIVGLKTMVKRIIKDHKRARLLAEELSAMNGINIDVEFVQTNLILMNVRRSGFSIEEFLNQMTINGVKAVRSGDKIRLAVHKDISDDDIDYVLTMVRRILRAQ